MARAYSLDLREKRVLAACDAGAASRVVATAVSGESGPGWIGSSSGRRETGEVGAAAGSQTGSSPPSWPGRWNSCALGDRRSPI